MFYPCHKKKNDKKKKKKNPSPKSIRRGSVRRLKFDTYTTHGLWAGFRGLGVQMTDVTRRPRTTRRTPPKYAITEHTKNLIVTHRPCLSKAFLDPKFFQIKNFTLTGV